MRKDYAIVVGCFLALTSLWLFTTNEPSLPSIAQLQTERPDIPPSHKLKQKIPTLATNMKPVPTPYVLVQPQSPNRDYLSEEDALKFEPLTDMKSIVYVNMSTVKLIGGRRIYNVGEDIKLLITLKDGYGRIRTKGGDKLHVRIYNATYDAYAPGYVIDHNNGTYTAVVPAIWPGRSVIHILLAYRRELIRVIYATERAYYTARAIIGRYESGKYEEEVVCQPVKDYLKQYDEVCNLTLANGGMSWYCGKPKNKILLCEDWTSVRAPPGKYLFTDEEQTLYRQKQETIRNILVKVEGTMQQRNGLPTCSSAPKKKSWTENKHSGYFYSGVWHLNHCNLPEDSKYADCLKGKHFVFFGDSTIRQWYLYLMESLQCEQLTEKWTREAWHKRTLCVNPVLNFTAEWIPHAQPFYVGDHWDTRKYTTHPISGYLNEFSDDSEFVIVIHMFSHFCNFHFSVFRDRMKAISRSTRHLLERNKVIKILVKGPHTFNHIRSYNYYMYRAIMKEEFRDLYDYVVFMEQGDMAIAKKNDEIHPLVDVMKEAVRQFIGYTCEG